MILSNLHCVIVYVYNYLMENIHQLNHNKEQKSRKKVETIPQVINQDPSYKSHGLDTKKEPSHLNFF